MVSRLVWMGVAWAVIAVGLSELYDSRRVAYEAAKAEVMEVVMDLAWQGFQRR